MKLFASDFDGTIYFHQDYDPKLVEAIREFQKQGNKFGLNTGRGLFSIEEIEPVSEQIPFDFYISDNGAILADSNKRIIHQKSFPREVAEQLLEALPKERLLFSIDGKYYLHPQMKAGRWTDRFETWDGSFERPIHSMSLECDTPQEVLEIGEELKGRNWPVELHLNRYSIDITLKGTDKTSQFEALKKFFKDPGAQIIAAGDSYNDLPALKEADLAYTFDYAPEELQQEASIVDTLAQAVEELTD